MVHIVADVAYGKNGAARYLLLNIEQPVRSNRVFRVTRERVYVLRSGNERRIGRGIVDRKWRICEDRIKEAFIVARERGHIGRGGKVEVHRIVENAAIPVDDGLSLASRVPCETHPGSPIAFRRAVCGLVRRKQGLGGHIESLPLVGTRR